MNFRVRSLILSSIRTDIADIVPACAAVKDTYLFKLVVRNYLLALVTSNANTASVGITVIALKLVTLMTDYSGIFWLSAISCLTTAPTSVIVTIAFTPEVSNVRLEVSTANVTPEHMTTSSTSPDCISLEVH